MKRIITFLILTLVNACASIPPQVDKCFSDDHDCMLVEDLIYSIGKSNLSVTVPEGFVTDFASIPKQLWSFGLSPHGRYSKAAIIHDYLYWSQGCTKEQSDNILLIAMKESGVSLADRIIIYEGVNVGGKSSWQSNTDEKNNNLPRVIPPSYWDFPGDITWMEYRKSLVLKGVKDPIYPKNPEYCKAGNSKSVPSNG